MHLKQNPEVSRSISGFLFSLSRHRQDLILHFTRRTHPQGSVQNFQRQKVAFNVIIQNYAGLILALSATAGSMRIIVKISAD
jgi:hypothetical protein